MVLIRHLILVKQITRFQAFKKPKVFVF